MNHISSSTYSWQSGIAPLIAPLWSLRYLEDLYVSKTTDMCQESRLAKIYVKSSTNCTYCFGKTKNIVKEAAEVPFWTKISLTIISFFLMSVSLGFSFGSLSYSSLVVRRSLSSCSGRPPSCMQQSSALQSSSSCSLRRPVWPVCHFGTMLKHFGHFESVYLVFGKILSLFWQICNALGQVFIVVKIRLY